jgi:hypothetical protein
MRFLLDESAEARIAGFLIAQGHDAICIGRDYPTSLLDEAVLAGPHAPWATAPSEHLATLGTTPEERTSRTRPKACLENSGQVFLTRSPLPLRW